MGLPQYVYVSVRDEGRPNEWLNCEPNALDAIEGDGPTQVGTYKLIAVNDLSKQVVSKPARKKGR
jgi:hypothetical protein